MTNKTKEMLQDAESDDSESFAAAFWIQMATIASLNHAKARRGGSVLGKAGHIQRDYEGAHHHFMKKYFWPANQMRPRTTQCGPEQPDSAFERRFRMPRSVFNRVCTGAVSHSLYL